MVREGFFANMRDAPELWVLTQQKKGVMLLLLLRWFFLSSTEQKQKNYTSDDDFEHQSPRGRIMLTDEDVQGFNLVQLEQIDATGKYLLPPKAKATVEEYRRIAYAADYDIKKENSPKNKKKQKQDVDDKFGEDLEDEEYGEKIKIIKDSFKYKQQAIQKSEMEQAKKEEEKHKKQKVKTQNNDDTPNLDNQKGENPNKQLTFNYAQRFQNKDKQKQTTTEQQNQTNEHNKINQQTHTRDTQNKSNPSDSQIDSISKLNPQKLQVFGSKQKKEMNNADKAQEKKDQNSQ